MRLLPYMVKQGNSTRRAFAIVDDALADMIRGNIITPIIIDNISTVEAYLNAIRPYVGNPELFRNFEYDYSFNQELSFDKLDFIRSVYPNMHYVERDSGSRVYEDNYFELFNKELSFASNNYSCDSCLAKIDNSYKSTAFSYATWFGNSGNTYRMYIPVFKEADIEDNIVHSLTTNYRWLTIAWYLNNTDFSKSYLSISSASVLYNSIDYAGINYFNYTVIPEYSGDDPYNPGGHSSSGGGPNTGGTGATGTGGLHDDTSDVIPIPTPPTSISTGTNIFTAYNPNVNQLASFAQKLWGGPSSIDDWFRMLTGGDAFNAIIGLHMLPVSPSTSGPSNIKLGNWDTEVSAPVINNQYVQHTFGTIMLPEYWGNAIDYSPYTRIQLALPYIGIVDVDTDDVLGSENTLTYNIDVLSGAICAMLKCIKGNLSSVIYQWSGSCAVALPISGANYNNILGGVLGVATGVAAIASGGVTIATGGSAAAIAAGASTLVGGSAASIGSAMNTYGATKGKVQKSGAFGANSGALGIKEPYFIITRPVQSVPSSWQADKGYPANISAQLSTVSGYTEVSEINLECSGTEAEKKEIVDLLKRGVIF